MWSFLSNVFKLYPLKVKKLYVDLSNVSFFLIIWLFEIECRRVVVILKIIEKIYRKSNHAYKFLFSNSC